MKGFIRSALYARVSSQKQAEEMTIESQLAAIHERVRRDGHEVAPEFELGVTGIPPRLRRGYMDKVAWFRISHGTAGKFPNPR
jgi:hypothetical protein